MTLILWVFLVLLGTPDGRVGIQTPMFHTQEECEQALADAPDIVNMHAEEWGIVTATGSKKCESFTLTFPTDPAPLSEPKRDAGAQPKGSI